MADLLNRVSLAVAYEKISAGIEYHCFRVRDSCERVFSENDVVGRREFQHDILPKGADKQVGRGVSYVRREHRCLTNNSEFKIHGGVAAIYAFAQIHS
jgi:hypothetical protein